MFSVLIIRLIELLKQINIQTLGEKEKDKKRFKKKSITSESESFNLLICSTTFSIECEDMVPTTQPSRRTVRTSGAPARSILGAIGVIPRVARSVKMDIFILRKFFNFPSEL
jgi:hypothetical protein